LQYFKCLASGHFAKHCKFSVFCGHCSDRHETKNCTKMEEARSCGNCKKWLPHERSIDSILNSKNCPLLLKEFWKGSRILTMDKRLNEYFFYVNCQSLLAHLDEFRYFFIDLGYYIIYCSKT